MVACKAQAILAVQLKNCEMEANSIPLNNPWKNNKHGTVLAFTYDLTNYTLGEFTVPHEYCPL